MVHQTVGRGPSAYPSLSQAPPQQAQAFFSQLPGAKPFQNGYWSYPCQANFTPQLEFAGVRFTIPEKCEFR